MRHTRTTTLCSWLAAVAFATTANAATQQVTPLVPAPSSDTGAAVDETPRLWFVELASPPTADGSSLSQVRSEKAAFRAAAKAAGAQYQERFAFDTLFNGVSVAASPANVARLKRVSGVKNVYPVGTVPMPQVAQVSEPDLAYAIQMTGADVAQSTLGLTGKGVKVAVMDTGIDYDHADLGGDGVARHNSPNFPAGRFVAGWDFVGDAYNADPTSPSYNITTTPDAYPDDCAGHGTHVAGIIGANGDVAHGGVKGVAPEVSFGVYRVFGCQGSTNDDVMIAAMERALADGMQVLNMSIGAAYEWPQSPTAMAATRLVNKGMVVVASIGNEGANGLYSAGSPGLGEKVIGVASFDNLRSTMPYFTASPDAMPAYYAPAAGAPKPPQTGSAPLARTGTKTTLDDACAALPAGSLAGKVALIRRGTCSFAIKSQHAQSAGALGVVLYNNTTGFVTPTVEGAGVTIPVVMISQADGGALNDRLAAGAVTLTWTDQVGPAPVPTAGLISSFSSYGLSPDLALKPDVGAPGGYIWSTYPLELGGHANLSGTSMASPHTAGAVALLLQAKPRTPSQAVRGILQNTAEPKAWWGNPGLGFLDNVSRQGAGLIQIDRAVQATTRVEPAKLSLGESQSGQQTQALTITNSGPADVTYDLRSVNALSVGRTFAPAFTTSDALVTFNVPSVLVPAGGSATVYATITPPSGPDHAQYGGYLLVMPRLGDQVYRVPFAGFVGDYQSIRALAPTAYGFPLLLGNNAAADGTLTFTMAGDDLAYLFFHLDHQVRTFRVDIQDAVTGRSWFMADREQYLPRNSTSTGYFSLVWDGVTYNGGGKIYVVPNGKYVMKVSVLKALGDDANPADWETWTSPPFVIAR